MDLDQVYDELYGAIDENKRSESGDHAAVVQLQEDVAYLQEAVEDLEEIIPELSGFIPVTYNFKLPDQLSTGKLVYIDVPGLDETKTIDKAIFTFHFTSAAYMVDLSAYSEACESINLTGYSYPICYDTQNDTTTQFKLAAFAYRALIDNDYKLCLDLRSDDCFKYAQNVDNEFHGIVLVKLKDYTT